MKDLHSKDFDLASDIQDLFEMFTSMHSYQPVWNVVVEFQEGGYLCHCRYRHQRDNIVRLGPFLTLTEATLVANSMKAHTSKYEDGGGKRIVFSVEHVFEGLPLYRLSPYKFDCVDKRAKDLTSIDINRVFNKISSTDVLIDESNFIAKDI